jgi:glycosyltransferase involved in cell wall biosynthesis
MKVLLLHNRYQIAGGEDIVVQAEKALLEANGHQVALLEANNDDITSFWKKAQAAANTIYSNSSKQWVSAEIASFLPDVVHVHNFLPLLSPSVYYACREANVPVVQTLHNYRLLCPNGLFFRDGKVCEDCLVKNVPWPGVVHNCYRGSKAGTTVVATMLSVHRALHTWTNMVDAYIALTEFARQKFIQGGLPAEKIVVKPNFVYSDPSQGNGQGGYALFVGRLSPEKGLETLLKAWEKIGKQLPLKIVGDGPLADMVADASQRLIGVEWLGRQPKEQVLTLMKEALVLVFPSMWYEGFPVVIAEAYAVGLPVIASNLGSPSSLIVHCRTGLHFRPNNPGDLTSQVEWVLNHPAEVTQMRQAARAEFEAKYTAQRNYQMLINIYHQLLSVKASATGMK